MTYIFDCTNCGRRVELNDRSVPGCYTCGFALRRNYRAENAGIAVADLKKEREHSKDERAAKMLPTNAEFAGPKDPDGTKGMRAWRDRQSPAPENKRPYWPGDVEKRVM